MSAMYSLDAQKENTWNAEVMRVLLFLVMETMNALIILPVVHIRNAMVTAVSLYWSLERMNAIPHLIVSIAVLQVQFRLAKHLPLVLPTDQTDQMDQMVQTDQTDQTDQTAPTALTAPMAPMVPMVPTALMHRERLPRNLLLT